MVVGRSVKRCGRCGQAKAAEYFYRASKARDGLHWWCIRCCRAYKRLPANVAYDRARVKERQRIKREEFTCKPHCPEHTVEEAA